MFVGGRVAGDRALDLGGGVLMDRQAVELGQIEQDASNGAEGERGRAVVAYKRKLDCGFCGALRADQFADGVCQRAEPFRVGVATVGGDCSAAQHGFSRDVEHGEAGFRKTWIKREEAWHVASLELSLCYGCRSAVSGTVGRRLP